MVNPNRFYTYAYLRKDRTPYYIGKGCGNRLYQNNGRPCGKPKDKSRIIFLKQNLTEEESFKHEKYMIAVFGRKDLGSGILHNRTDGGEGCSGLIHTVESKIKISEAIKGENHYFYGKSHSEEIKRKLSELKKGKPLSEETKRKLSELRKGENNPFYGKSHSDETKIKISQASKGENHHLYGKSLCEETKRKMSEIKMGENNPFYGKSHSEENRRKISERNKGKKWWNDGCGNTKFCLECPGEDWVLGRKEKVS